MMTRSEPAVSAGSFVPTTVAPLPSIAAAWFRSRAIPCGRPSITSIRQISLASSCWAQRWATVMPTWPAPTTVSLRWAMADMRGL